MTHRRQVTVLYSEKNLQKTISLPVHTTVAIAKREGMEEIRKHLQLQPGVPTLEIDPDCTDFYPDAQNDAKIGDLDGGATMVVWPAPPPGSHLTPSPILDSLRDTFTGLNAARARENAEMLIKESSSSHQPAPKGKKAKSGSTPTPTSDEPQSKWDEILQRLTLVEESNAKLKESNAKLKDILSTTMRAVTGDRVAINKIRNRVLLDLGRDKLAEICGYKDWKDWKSNATSKDAMVDFASRHLTTSDEVHANWKELGSQQPVLQRLIFPSQVRSRGDIAAHSSALESIAESVLALRGKEREDMTTIYRAIYGINPAMNVLHKESDASI